MTVPIDATRALHGHVTRRHVANATPGDDTACAAAQCLLDRKDIAAVSIGATTALVQRTNGKVYRYVLAPETQAVIRAFDDSALFPEITVHLLPPTGKQKWGARAGEQHGTNVRSGKKNTTARNLARQASRHVHIPT